MGGDEKIELSGLRMPSTSTNQPKNKQTDRNVGKKKPLMKISGKKEQRIFESASTSGLYRMSVSSVHM